MQKEKGDQRYESRAYRKKKKKGKNAELAENRKGVEEEKGKLG
jgi:hypothetical protein